MAANKFADSAIFIHVSRRMRRACLFLVTIFPALPLAAAQPVNFNRDVRPILSENCYACHGFDKEGRKADLRLDTHEGATATNDGVTAVVPGKPDESELIARINTTDKDDVMPPPKSKKTLTAAQKETLRRWIAEGAEYQGHWAFVRPERPRVPGMADFGLRIADWEKRDPPRGAELRRQLSTLEKSPLSPIDAFILDRLLVEGLTPSPEAAPETLARRIALDLTGLPPSESAIRNPQSAIETLLASPHYGERWGRWWLDQARYADSNGYSIDAPRQIWKFRDWVIDALNADMPFDRFTIEQLAGDLLPNATESQKIATGFHRNTQINQEGGIDKEQFRIDSVFDRVATTGTVWLGLTVGCAQCHDHKFDPIAQKEYYRLFAFLNNQDEPTMKVFDPSVDVSGLTAEFEKVEAELKKRIAERYDEITAWEKEMTPAFRRKLSGALKKAVETPVAKRTLAQQLVLFAAVTEPSDPIRVLSDRHKELDTALNQGAMTLVLKELPQPRKTTVFIKGDFTRPAEEVTPGTLSVLHPFEKPEGQPTRLHLAHWIVSPRNPLTARVIVNRVWQQYFGRGIVETENDFGLQGTPPSHPELLDWLATEFIARKWSLKELHRLIVTSRTYRQSSADRPELREKDPDNRLLARQTRLRLDAEIVRDVALSASGLLSPKLGGPPVYPPIPEGVMGQGQVKRTWTVSKGADKYRRGIYTFIYRASPPPALNVFDAPDGFSSCTRRIRSNTPLQALTLMNDAGFFEFATAFEKIIAKDGLETAFRRCTSRAPKPEELAILTKLDPLNAARALLNLDETVTRE
jgi:hypothetical protein